VRVQRHFEAIAPKSRVAVLSCLLRYKFKFTVHRNHRHLGWETLRTKP